MLTYLNLLQTVLRQGELKGNRTGIDTLSVFGHQMRFSLSDQFPLLTTKKVHFKSLVHELLWFLRGDTNVGYLKDHNVRIWNEWANESGDLGRIYGAQWRSWQTPDGKSIDQITQLVENLKTDPFSRRHLVVAFNPGELDKMALPPCHAFFQFYVSRDKKLSCQLYQRSADVFLGVPFNIASYALLTYMLAQVTGLVPHEFIHTLGDAHIYTNHIQQVETQLKRQPRALPKIKLNSEVKDIFSFTYDDFEILNYKPHDKISAEVVV